MSTSIASLTAFSEAVMARQVERFEPIVKAAYAAGFDRQELLAAVDVAKLIADVPPAVSMQAYLTVHTWNWMAYRRTEPQAAPTSLPASHEELPRTARREPADAFSVAG
jgi:hypothetical protein